MAEDPTQQCIMCKIIKGEIPSKKIYEDDKVVAIADINPATKGHTIIMPKEHFFVLQMAPADLIKHIAKASKYISKAIKDAIVTNKCSIFIASGAPAGQQMPHAMIHVLAREKGDSLPFEKKIVSVDEKKTEEVRQKLISVLQPKAQADPKQQLAQVLQANPQLQELLVNNTEEFKKQVGANPQLQKLFEGVDIDALAGQLKNGN